MNEAFLKFQLGQLFSWRISWLITTTFASLTFAYIFQPYPRYPWMMSVWAVAYILVNVFRYYLKREYENGTKEDTWLLKWYSFAVYIAASLWGVVSLILINRIPDGLSAILTGYLLGAATSGSIVVSGRKQLSAAFIILTIMPYAIKILVEQNSHWVIYGALCVFLVVALVGVFKRFYLLQVKTFELLQETEGLYKQVTEKYDLEKQLKEEKLKSLQASKYAAIGEMAAGVGHEINNPLTIVLGALWKMGKVIEKNENNEELLSLVNQGSNASKRIADVVTAMREYSSLKTHSKVEELNLSSIVSMCKPLIDRSFSDSKVKIVYNFEDATVVGELTELSQVLFNIVTNAFQAAQDSKQKLVVINSFEDEEGVNLTISNSGKEIDEQVSEKMFQPFFSTKEVGKGSGLGLSLAKTIIENNQGEIFHNRNNDMTVFTMKLRKA